MDNLKFRAVLCDPGAISQERPIQIYGNSRADIDSWAEKVLGTSVSKNAAVLVYQTVETQVGIINRPKPATEATV